MPMGSMPGERRGGRQPGTTNRRTILIDRILAVGLEFPMARPRELVATLAGDQALPGGTRRALAPKTLLQSGRRGQELKALFRIVQDQGVVAKERRQAALAVSKILLPEKPAVTKWRATPDDYGFAVNPEIANEYRDKLDQLHKLKKSRRAVIPAVAQTMGKLQADLDHILERSPCSCPTLYDNKAADGDQDRLQYFRNKIQADIALTDAEKAEEAHRRVRFESFASGPEQTARRRRQELEAIVLRLKRQRFFEKGTARLKRKAAATLRLLRWLYPPVPPLEIQEGDDWRAHGHPFATEEPAADGNFYEFVEFIDVPPVVFSSPNYPPYSDLPLSKWPKTEEEFKTLTQGMIQQGWGYWSKAGDTGNEQATPYRPRSED